MKVVWGICPDPYCRTCRDETGEIRDGWDDAPEVPEHTRPLSGRELGDQARSLSSVGISPARHAIRESERWQRWRAFPGKRRLVEDPAPAIPLDLTETK